MADPMTDSALRDLLNDAILGVGPDAGDVMDAVDDLIGQARTEVERLRAELDDARQIIRKRTGERDDAHRRENNLLVSLVKAKDERDQLAEQVRRVREVIAPADWEHAQVYARKIREALDGGERRG